MEKNWLFSILSTNISKKNTLIYKKSMMLLVDKANEIISKNPEEFLKLVFALEQKD